MKSVCLYFDVHQPQRLKRYRFFNMGCDVNYLDDYANKAIMLRNATHCYKPMNNLLKKLIQRYEGRFKVSFSISGSAIELMKQYTPDILDSFVALVKGGHVEILGGSYTGGLSSLVSDACFKEDADREKRLIEDVFGVTPTAFCNSELIYSDHIGEVVAEMGYKAMITEDAKHVLGWRSPGFLYTAAEPRLKLLLRNGGLSDDLRYRFSDKNWEHWPMTSHSFLQRIKADEHYGDIINLVIDYETFGHHHKIESGIFDFIKHLAEQIDTDPDLCFSTPSDVLDNNQPKAVMNVPYPISWADQEKDTSAWFGNELQAEAFSKLYALRDNVMQLNCPEMNHVWDFMQSSSHFFYMNTKLFSNNKLLSDTIYDSPYDAFINYMNVLSDFAREVSERLEERTAKTAEV